MNISSSSMRSSLSIDRTDRQLFNSTLNNRFDPTARAIQSNHETDKQVEDNVTWLYEYKALLNSKLTTLTTALASAYTTDLDISMGAKSGAAGSQAWGKNAMQGLTGGPGSGNTTAIDPGAARTAYAYLTTWRNVGDIGVTAPPPTAPATQPSWRGNGTESASQSASVTMGIANMSDGAASGSVTGTTTFISGGRTSGEPMELDRLVINFVSTTQNRYFEDKEDMTGLGPELTQTPNETALDPSFTARDINIGNNFERTLYKFFLDRQNLDLIKFGLFNDLIVVGTSSLPTGSQTQGSLSLTWDQNLAAVRIYQERYACFYHS